jgi:hypothetical protein
MCKDTTPAQHAKDPLCVEHILERHHGIVGEADKGTSALETWSHLELEPFIQHVKPHDEHDVTVPRKRPRCGDGLAVTTCIERKF